MKLVYLSGIDGCGKTTQAKLLVDALQRKGLSAKYQWFRWKPSFRDLIKTVKPKREVLLNANKKSNNKYSIEKNWLIFKRRILAFFLFRKIWLYYACFDYYFSYTRNFKKVTTDIVVIDRYLTDFIIDQAINLNVMPKETDILRNNIFLKKFHFPDLNIIIDLPAYEGYGRKNDGTPLSYLQVREKYYLSINSNNTLHLNGLNSIDDLAFKISQWVIDKIEAIKV